MNFRFIGWCKDSSHDKVWGVITLDSHQSITFWGRRGKKLQTNIVTNNRELQRLIDSKIDKGYTSIPTTQLDVIYPQFQDDLEKTAIWVILSR